MKESLSTRLETEPGKDTIVTKMESRNVPALPSRTQSEEESHESVTSLAHALLFLLTLPVRPIHVLPLERP